MAWTFGGATTDDATLNITSSGASGTIIFGSCWVYPTTLTATRAIWSIGNNWTIRIDTTTSELRFISDNTTDGEWTTTGVGLATNTWTFLAWMASPLNTGPTLALRIWAGNIDTRPVEVTVTNAVAPVGNFTGATSLTWGNRGSGSVAFQGDIENAVYGSFNGTVNDRVSPFATAAAGTITQTEANFVRDRYVLPMWQGNLYPYEKAFSGLPAGSSGLFWYVLRMNLGRQSLMEFALRTAAGTPVGALTALNGSTASANRAPIPALNSHVTLKTLRRR